MGGGKMGGRGRFWRSGPVSEAPPVGIRTPQPLPLRAPPSAGPLGRGFWVRMPIAGASETGPDRQNRPRPPHAATTHLAPAERRPAKAQPSSKPYEFTGFGATDVTKPYEFIGFGAMDVTKPYEFIGFGAMDVTKPYEFIGFGAMDVTKPYKFIGFGATDATRPYDFIGFGARDVTKPYEFYSRALGFE